MVPFLEALKSGRILIMDGAMGTQLAARGGITGPLSNFECLELVEAVHIDYKNAGANIILANTFAGNRIALEHAGMADRLEDINRLGVEICRNAVGDSCYVCGDIGSTGKFMEPLGEYTEKQFYDNFAEQAELLAKYGVDLIIVETMTDVAEACVAVRAVKESTGLPVIASISFDPVADGFRTMMGQTPEYAAESLTNAGADVVGTNCGTIDPFECSNVIARMREATNLYLAAQPNAGKPELSAGQVTFKLSPEDFAEGVLKCIECGAVLAGGCCGTTPEHIKALVDRL